MSLGISSAVRRAVRPARPARTLPTALPGVGLALLLTLLLAAPALAQPGGRMDPDKRLTHLTKVLDLSEEQQQAIRPLLEEEALQVGKVFEETRESGQRKQMRQSVREIRTSTDTRIEAELSDEQKQRFAKLRADQRARMAERRQQGGKAKGQGGKAKAGGQGDKAGAAE